MISDTIRRAIQLWDYMSSRRQRSESDAIVVCCSYDLQVADYACELFKAGLAPVILFSGDTGNWTRHIWSRPEAHIFRDRAIEIGVPESAIIVEDQATNFGENIRFARSLLPLARSAIFLTKPNSVLRVSLTVPVQWPSIAAAVDSPPLKFPDEVSNVVGILGVIAEMVGDLQRVIEYPALGFQVAHSLPPDIENAWHALIAAGFTGHMMRSETPKPAV